MKNVMLVLLLLVTVQVWSAETVELKNQFVFFSQKTNPEYSLPDTLSEKIELAAQFEVPAGDGPMLRKVFTQDFQLDDLKVIFEIYFFNQNSQRYLSQQIKLYKAGAIISKCTSYFGLTQKYLVPGACAGVSGELLYGVAVYK